MTEKKLAIGNILPPVLRDIAKESIFDSLEPGEETWTVPWALAVDAEGVVHIRKGMVDRHSAPGGTANIKIVKDFDGIYIDATALTREDIESHLKPEEDMTSGIVGGREEDFVPVEGVIYPVIEDERGMDPAVIDEFNRQQIELQSQFTDHIQDVYHRGYVLAKDEYPGYRNIPGISQ